MAASLKKIKEVYELLKTYNGDNPYIVMCQKQSLNNISPQPLDNFQIEYILRNWNFIPQQINKVINIAEWYGEKKKDDWGIKFTPQRVKIMWLLGETDTAYHCYILFKQNQLEAKQAFMPKKAVMDDFLAKDYGDLELDFDILDNISTQKNPDRKIMLHQKEAAKFLITRKKCILADDPGLGKTNALISASLLNDFKKVLIICPASIKSTWKRELMWYVDENEIVIINSIDGKNKSELEELLGYEVGKSGKKVGDLKIEAKERGKWVSGKKFTIINYDILNDLYKIPLTRSNDSIKTAFNESPMLQEGFDLVIIDEIHKLSNTKSNRYKIINDFIKRSGVDYVWGASGTMITNKPINFYNVLKLLKADVTNDWQYYVERYCNGFQIPARGEKQRVTALFLNYKRKNNYYELTEVEKEELKIYIRQNAKMIWITDGASNLEELRDKTRHLYLRRIKEDIPGMVNKYIHERYYEFNQSQWNEYNKLYENYEDAKIAAGEEINASQELIEGTLFKQYVAKQMLPNTIKLAEDFIEDEEKVFIVCTYDEEVYTLQSHFGDNCVVFNGKMNEKQKLKAETDFMTDPNKKVFIGQIIASGVGLTLTAARICLFNSFSFVPGDNTQVMDRLHRICQKRDVDVYYQMFIDTYYEKMWESVIKKEFVINEIVKKEDEKR